MIERIEELGPARRVTNEWKNNSITDASNSLTAGDKGLATSIGYADKDSSGRPIDPAVKETMERLRTWNIRIGVDEPTRRNLNKAFNELDRLKHTMAIGEGVIEKAAYIYRKAANKGLVRGRSVRNMIAAALYAACRGTDMPRTLKDIALHSSLEKNDIAKCYRLLVKELELKMPVPDPIKCAARIANKASVSEKTKRRAIDILKKADTAKISAGKEPMGLAAAALYVASILNGEEKTQQNMANAAGVSDLTVKNIRSEILTSLDLQI